VNLPADLGRRLLGETWPAAQPLLLGLGIFGAGLAASSGLVVGLRCLAAAHRSFVAMVPAGIGIVVCGTLGASVAGANGAVVGTIAPAWAGAVAVAWQFHRAIGDEHATAEARRSVVR
jgi:hypothetical protein